MITGYLSMSREMFLRWPSDHHVIWQRLRNGGKSRNNIGKIRTAEMKIGRRMSSHGRKKRLRQGSNALVSS